MRAIARAVAVLCAWIGRLLTRCSGTLEKLSASEALAPDTNPDTKPNTNPNPNPNTSLHR